MGIAFDAGAFLADPHAELDRVIAAALAEIEAQVAAWNLPPHETAFARSANAAKAAELREEIRQRAVTEAQARGHRIPADHGALRQPLDALAAAVPAGSA